MREEGGAVHVSQACRTERTCDCMHLIRDGGIDIGQVLMACADPDQDQRISELLEVEGEALGGRSLGILEVDVGKPAQADGRLVHEATGLAEPVVLDALAQACHPETL